MIDAHLRWNENAMAKLQQEINAKAHDVIRQVNASMAKRPVNEVMQALRTQLAAIGVEPDEDDLRHYAQAISDGTLTE
jgi:hypothetical protein